MRIEALTNGTHQTVKVVTIAGRIAVLYGTTVLLRDATNRLAVRAYLTPKGFNLPV